MLPVFALLWAVASGADAPRESPALADLHLKNGGFVSGTLCDSPIPPSCVWQAGLFASPFEFRLNQVESVYYPPPAKIPKPAGEYCFELSNGDVLWGSLRGWNADEAELDVPTAGRLHLRRKAIRQFFRWKEGSGLVYQGPHGLDDWTVLPSTDAWRIEHGQLTTEEPRIGPRQVCPAARAAIDLRDFLEKQGRFHPGFGNRREPGDGSPGVSHRGLGPGSGDPAGE